MANRDRSADRGLSNAALIAVVLFVVFVLVFVFATPFWPPDALAPSPEPAAGSEKVSPPGVTPAPVPERSPAQR